MKNWPSAVFTITALLILPLAITGCDRKTEKKETKVINEPAPAPVVHETIINQAPRPPVVNETRINETNINEKNVVNERPPVVRDTTNSSTTIIEKKN